MKQVFLIPEKIYGPQIELAFHSIRSSIRNEISELKIKMLNIDINERGWIQLTLEGEDAEAAKNFLNYEFGSTYGMSDLHQGLICRGKLVEPTKFGYGVYVDIGLDSNKKDVFIPLFKLREQLLNNLRRTLRKIITNFALIENFPLELEIIKVDKETNNIKAKLSDNQVSIFKKWINSALDRIIICGSTRQQIRKAIIKSGHLQDILSIERLGLLEQAVVCKYNTEAPGLISEIGKFLPNIPMKGFIPKNIKSLMS
ncbi:MAG: DUF2110 family protein [Candidatus Jordarchaeum sp.]|uniref:DUF2110 family protein n=1 Tax=Candidatus Jordarchaeum sp. TaxID=2823881 RepID=UPI0040491AE1